MNEISKKEGRTIHRIDLSLPVVQTDSYEIFYTIPPLATRQKPLIDFNKKFANLSIRNRTHARLKHLTGPVDPNLVVDTLSSTTESTSTMTKNSKNKNLKDDGDRSRSSSGDRLLYESLGSFDDYYSNKSRSTNTWQNFHHPQLTSSKILHVRRTRKSPFTAPNPSSLKFSNTNSLETLSQESINEQLHERIEQLTKAYFPSIQQIRNGQLCPELAVNRMHLYREQKKSFLPIFSRSRIV